jgi:CelD/BcsL family acetyltransferase involved in cellulose biosynthesis
LATLLIRDGESLIGLAPLCRRTHSYAPGVRFRRLELLASGENEADEICSDYIGLIAERGREIDVAQAVARALVERAAGDWDELVMPAMNGESLLPWALADALRKHGVPTRAELSAPSPFISLPASFDEYLARLSSSRRYTLRRAMRDFNAWAKGGASFEVAATHSDVERGLSILRDLHAGRWQSDGRPGAFSSRAFSAFHADVIHRLLDAGSLDLSWLSVDGEPIAAAYSIVHAGRVQFYQSGRKAGLPAKVRPGLVLHVNAIQRAISAGHREYDFLPGPSQYKLGLALATRPLVVLRAAPPSLREAARVVGELVMARGRLLRAAVAPDPQLLRQDARSDRQTSGEVGVAPDLARTLLHRLRSPSRSERNPLHP